MYLATVGVMALITLVFWSVLPVSEAATTVHVVPSVLELTL
jgi:hypothetical protein